MQGSFWDTALYADHLARSHPLDRAGWMLVTTSNPGDALNFSRSGHVARDMRYERVHYRMFRVDRGGRFWVSSASTEISQRSR